MICPRCGTSAASDNKFCGDCGSPLPRRCDYCGAESSTAKRFCGDCGAAFTPASRGLPEPAVAASGVAERRQLTVMFADLVGSTRLATRLDPEDLREVIASYRSCVNGLAARFDGFVARYLGDGVLVYFGYPHAHEDDPERAVSAGLAITEAVGALVTMAGPPGTLGARVGIATGLVVTGELIACDASLEPPVVGGTPNLAARLQAVAEPGTVVIAETTRCLTGGLFEYRELAPVSVKGLAAPVHAWAVQAESPVESRFEALRARHMPLIGRLDEIELLLRRWEQAKAGQGRVVLVTGEAGIGKSRLIAALEARVGGTQRRYLCWPHCQDTPLHPVVRQLEHSAKFERGDPPAAKLEKLRRVLVPGEALNTDVALFADLLSIPEAESHLAPDLAPQRRKQMTFAAILRQFQSCVPHGPLLAILEDIHWADPTSLDLLDLLVETVERLPILLVVSARPEVKPSWAARAHVTVQLLNTLSRPQAVSLIGEVAGDASLPDDVVERIIAHADGVPLFIEELTKTVLESGVPRKNAGHLELVEPRLVDLVPTTLHASLMARLDRLAGAKEIAQIGSVIGREFSFELLRELSGLPAKRLQEALDELEQAGLTIAHGRASEATYAFKHALVQDTAYASLLRGRRRAIHLRLAEQLEKEDAVGTEPQLAAWHFARGGAPDRSIDYYLKAAARATGRLALAERVSYLREGLRQVKHLPQSVETRRRELALQVELGRALIDHEGSGSEEVRTVFERARELCLDLDEMKQLLRVHDGLANYYLNHSEHEKVLYYADEMLEVGRETGDPRAFLIARRSGGIANLLLGRFEQARHELQLLLDMYDGERDGPHAALMPRDPKVSACTALGICLTAMGYPASGAAVSLEGVKHGESLHHAISVIHGLRRACVQRMIQRDTQGVVEFSARLLGTSTEYETFKGTRDGTIFHCWAQLRARRDPALLEQMLARIEQFDATKHWALLPFFMTCAAELQGDHGDPHGALALLDRAAELARLTGEQWCDTEIIRLQARFGAGSAEEAIAMLQTGLARAREQGAKLWELRTATSLADLWRRQGKRSAAREVLAPTYAWFTEGFDSPDLIAARELLETLGARRSRDDEKLRSSVV